uniref:Sushi domain-containing protein n=1 Tax=Panagrolaimus sp. ES5 TaxID=591445 RepID=A0AC34GW93_9BILA
MRGRSAVRICQENGNWSTPEMYCKLPICLITEATIENGKLEISNAEYIIADTNVTVKCLDGYAINGSNIASCNVEGHWNKPLPKCEFLNCSHFDCGNGIARKVEGYNACRCECQYGYWQNYNESGPCVDIDECAMNYSLCSYGTMCVNGLGNYSCDLDTPNETFAIYNYLEMLNKEFPEQLFVSPDITVVRKRCTEVNLYNAILQPIRSLRLVGEILEIYCIDSQILNVIECQSNSFWNVTPSCPVMKAPACTLPLIEGLILTPQQDSYTLGQHVQFSCQDDNYIFIGPSSTVCTLFNNDIAGFIATPICQ